MLKPFVVTTDVRKSGNPEQRKYELRIFLAANSDEAFRKAEHLGEADGYHKKDGWIYGHSSTPLSTLLRHYLTASSTFGLGKPVVVTTFGVNVGKGSHSSVSPHIFVGTEDQVVSDAQRRMEPAKGDRSADGWVYGHICRPLDELLDQQVVCV